MAEKHELAIIGAGPGGYVAAIRAAQLGINTACIEKEARLGGTCLRIGCIPSKALLESSEKFYETKNELDAHGIRVRGAELDLGTLLDRKDKIVEQLTGGVASLFKKYGVACYKGTAELVTPDKVRVKSFDGETEIETERVIIATGSVPASLPGVEFDDEGIVGTSTEALSYSSVPETMIVIGGGYIGLEMGSVWARLGAKVTVLEYLDRLLPGMDAELAREAQRFFKKQGLEFKLGVKVTSATAKYGKGVVEVEGEESFKVDRVLVAVGRKPATEGLGLENLEIRRDDKGRIEVDEDFRTSVEGVYAIGDAIPGPMLAHKAMDEGIACVERIAGHGLGHVNYDAIPAIVYTDPEIASVGKTEEQLKDEGVDYNVGKFFFKPNGRALALGKTDGRLKILADKKTDRILGIHIIGPRAGDLIAECTTAIAFGASSRDLALTSHAHPTLAEVIKEAAHAVTEDPIHG